MVYGPSELKLSNVTIKYLISLSIWVSSFTTSVTSPN